MAGKSSHAVTLTHSEVKDSTGLERLIFFSDAVFAIAITLLALEIRLPDTAGSLSNADLLHTLLGLWPKYLGYLISFLVIGLFWVGHHRKFRYITGYDNNLLLLNLLLLMTVAFSPFPASVLIVSGNRTATIFYALTMMLIGLTSGAIWWYASYKDRLIDPRLDAYRRRREAWGPLLVPVIFLVSIGLAFIDNNLARVSWVLVGFASLALR
jgi:uncharacterized membrane protein